MSIRINKNPLNQVVTTNTTLTAKSPEIIVVDASLGNVTITLPGLLTSINKKFSVIQKDGTANTVTIVSADALIDGATNLVIAGQYYSATVYNTTTEWLSPKAPSPVSTFIESIITADNTNKSIVITPGTTNSGHTGISADLVGATTATTGQVYTKTATGFAFQTPSTASAINETFTFFPLMDLNSVDYLNGQFFAQKYIRKNTVNAQSITLLISEFKGTVTGPHVIESALYDASGAMIGSKTPFTITTGTTGFITIPFVKTLTANTQYYIGLSQISGSDILFWIKDVNGNYGNSTLGSPTGNFLAPNGGGPLPTALNLTAPGSMGRRYYMEIVS